MRVLSVNCGSSTLKFDVLDMNTAGRATTRVAKGIVDRIGGGATTSLSAGSGRLQRDTPAQDHGEAFGAAVGLLQQVDALSGVGAIGHRVVHGGVRFRAPAIIDQAFIDAIEGASELAPLHNQPSLAAIRAAISHFGDQMPMVATFDTAFYTSLPDVSSVYALPRDVSEKLGIRRFGFHGLAHRYMAERFRELRPEVSEPRLITL